MVVTSRALYETAHGDQLLFEDLIDLLLPVLTDDNDIHRRRILADVKRRRTRMRFGAYNTPHGIQ